MTDELTKEEQEFLEEKFKPGEYITLEFSMELEKLEELREKVLGLNIDVAIMPIDLIDDILHAILMVNLKDLPLLNEHLNLIIPEEMNSDKWKLLTEPTGPKQ